MAKAFSQACENNKDPILSVFKRYITASGSLLEIGSGTGQHAAYFASQLPHLNWQPSDLTENIESIESWREEAQLPNLLPCKTFDANHPPVCNQRYPYLFSANTQHIMSWQTVEKLWQQLPLLLTPGALAFFYGPFKYRGEFTSPSNASFDLWLKERGSHQGVRDFEAIEALANRHQLQLVEDVKMPANNQLLVWQFTNQS